MTFVITGFEVAPFSLQSPRRGIYSVAQRGGRVRLTDGTDLEVDPIFEGVFALPGG